MLPLMAPCFSVASEDVAVAGDAHYPDEFLELLVDENGVFAGAQSVVTQAKINVQPADNSLVAVATTWLIKASKPRTGSLAIDKFDCFFFDLRTEPMRLIEESAR